MEINNLSLNLSEGWNMISGTSYSNPAITDFNNIIVSGTLYRFNSGYIQAQSIEPGIGYWIRAISQGEIVIENLRNNPPLYENVLSRNKNNKILNQILINKTTLYFGRTYEKFNNLSYSLPPTPPEGAFDVRFINESSYSEVGGVIKLQSSNSQISISSNILDNSSWILINSSTGEVYNLFKNNNFIIDYSEEFYLEKVNTDYYPKTFILKQNFPNPFNPSTKISYIVLSEDYIDLSIYNAKGEFIKKLKNAIQRPGSHSVIWNGVDFENNPVPSGIYIYKLSTKNNFLTKKMILIR